jgi:oligoribonuclease NrnB/cAMP/cGMP phosphodiesterase (DHH superfamily)
MKTLCIYHGGCDDGFGAAYAVWKKFGYEVEYYPATHGGPIPDVNDRDVIMVDFSYKRNVLLQLIGKCKSMVILDHHKTAEADLDGLEDPKLTLVFDMQRSGATIAWDHFHPDTPRPVLIRYVEDRDLWLKRLRRRCERIHRNSVCGTRWMHMRWQPKVPQCSDIIGHKLN